MQRSALLLMILLLLTQAAAVRANEFVLENDDYKQVNSSYSSGDLLGSSIADVVEGGYISYAYIYDQARLNILEFRYGTYGDSVGSAYLHDSSSVNISSGHIGKIWVNNLMHGSDRINVTGGKIWELVAHRIDVAQNQNFSFSASASDLTLWGVQAIEGTVDFVSLNQLYAYEDSIVNIITGGWVKEHIYARDNSTVNMSGGMVGWVQSGPSLSAHANSTINISDGSNVNLRAYDTSTVNISDSGGGFYCASSSSTVNNWGYSGGDARGNSTVNIYGGYTAPLKTWDSSTVNISGGKIWQLITWDSSKINISGGEITSGLYTYDNSTVNISGGVISGSRAGWSYPKSLSVKDSSTVNISGGEIKDELYTYDSSTIKISGGSVERLYTDYDSTVNISGGSVERLYTDYDSSIVSLYGHDFELGEGLSWYSDGQRILGTGLLTGKWFDGTSWTINIGRNETTATIRAVEINIADLDGSGTVDMADFSTMAGQWLQSGDLTADISGPYGEPDGYVDIWDFAAFCDNWLWDFRSDNSL